MARSKNGGRYRMSATPAIVMAEIFAVTAITLMLVSVLHFEGGFSLKAENKRVRLFNAHFLFMLFGPIISTGQAIMAFKIVPGTRKARKIVHMLLNLLGIFLGALGLIAIFRLYKESQWAPNVHSLHSWTGLGVIGLYVIQFFLGFTFFLFPGAKKNMRTDMKPWHAFLGLTIFMLAIFTSGTGLIQRFRFLELMKGREALLLNFTGIAIVLFGISVVLSVILS
ncbi:ascorbate-specific transmembrane electron transporter 2-like [Dendrobium catenatum]|uniref:Transmembrane ascorbate ferrireductase 1 n=1 Tax=Dendrobium catenatum TaxID=906689 RepID=A0A2I0W558_9ASPA|nr:ascorbate-specific transmembrane electron transporter 2-like [Dendrobium catenatum]PKU70796.1 Transmembrane ascorbate ferrireductase 1 [Dendrobium catenatum]